LNAYKATEALVVCERIRTFSMGKNKNGGKPLQFMNIGYIKATGALIATIVDVAYQFGVKVYSVDTRSWKAQVVGTTKGGKAPTLAYVKSLGFDVKNDDAADSACIALYPFCKKQNLKLEE